MVTPSSPFPPENDDDLLSIAAKEFAKLDYFTMVRFSLEEEVLPIKDPWMIWDFEVIGETADYFVLWKWDPVTEAYTPGLMRKSEMPERMADFEESRRKMERHAPAPAETVAKERGGFWDKIRGLFGRK